MRDGLKNEGPATPDPARGARPAGGGHAAAAGATLHCNQAEARTRVLEVLRSLGMVQAV